MLGSQTLQDVAARRRAANAVLAAGGALSAMADALHDLRGIRQVRALTDAEQARFDQLCRDEGEQVRRFEEAESNFRAIAG